MSFIRLPNSFIFELAGIVQMRPSYTYFDKQDKRKRDKSKEDNSDDEEKEPEAQQVIVIKLAVACDFICDFQVLFSVLVF